MSLWTTGETITAERINSQRADWSEDDSTSLAYIANKQLVEDEITQTQSDVGNLSNLTTTAKSSLVAAVNEVDADVASVSSQVATNTSAISDLNEDLGDLDAIKTALLACFDGVAWAGTNGAALREALYVALFNPYWAISATFTNCTSSNNSGSILKGEAYTATISANAGYSLTGATVSVTMNSVDITSQVYSNGVITIPSVTGDLVISVSAAVMQATSISAVYTQSGIVYAEGDVDDLKTDLVVTATYEDSSTATLSASDYTLSGTLTEGTSTITVTYGNLTTTFDVTVTLQTIIGVLGYGSGVDDNGIFGLVTRSDRACFAAYSNAPKYKEKTSTASYFEDDSPYSAIRIPEGAKSCSFSYGTSAWCGGKIYRITNGYYEVVTSPNFGTGTSFTSTETIQTYNSGDYFLLVFINGTQSSTSGMELSFAFE